MTVATRNCITGKTPLGHYTLNRALTSRSRAGPRATDFPKTGLDWLSGAVTTHPLDQSKTMVVCASTRQVKGIADGKAKTLQQKCQLLLSGQIEDIVTTQKVTIKRYDAQTDGPFRDHGKKATMLKRAASDAKKRAATEPTKAKKATGEAAETSKENVSCGATTRQHLTILTF